MKQCNIPLPYLFDIDKIFDCGQCFRFNKIAEKTWNGVVNGMNLTLFQKEDNLSVSGTDDVDFIKNFLSLDIDYEAINSDIALCLNNNSNIIEAIEKGKGIRILRQDKWETICSFIVSQNNNIPRIKGIIEKLCRLCGEKVDGDCYSFPSAQKVALLSLEELRKIGLGYRAEYMQSVSSYIASNPSFMDELSEKSTAEFDSSIRKLHGVGPKVAACIELFGFSRYDVFPVDVWIKRALSEQYAGYSPEDFGVYRGIAQQYIFYSQIHK